MAYLDGNEILFSPHIVLGGTPTDQEYNPESENAQSGKAVAEATSTLSQGRSAKYNFTAPGWKRILNVIRATNGTVNIGVSSSGNHRMVHILAFDFSGFVKYGADTNSSAKPILLKRYENIFGNDNVFKDGGSPCKITKVRVAYPVRVTNYPNGDGIVGPGNPVNCYIDVYVDFDETVNSTRAFNMNYSGFANSHNCEAILEETDATPKGIYDENLTYYELSVDSMPYYLNSNIVHSAAEGSASWGAYGVTMSSDGKLRTAFATNDDIDKGWNKYKVICPANLKYAVRSVMLKSVEEETLSSTSGDFVGQIGIAYDIEGTAQNMYLLYIYAGYDDNTQEHIWRPL